MFAVLIILAIGLSLSGAIATAYILRLRLEEDAHRRRLELIERGIVEGSPPRTFLERIAQGVLSTSPGERLVLARQARRLADLERRLARLEDLAERVETLETIAVDPLRFLDERDDDPAAGAGGP